MILNATVLELSTFWLLLAESWENPVKKGLTLHRVTTSLWEATGLPRSCYCQETATFWMAMLLPARSAMQQG